MNIRLKSLGKRYNQNWIYRGIDIEIPPNSRLAILGNNGSGKSTLLQAILGSHLPSEGEVIFQIGSELIEAESIYSHCSISAPYLDLFEELSFAENIEFQGRFKPFRLGFSKEDMLNLVGLSKFADHPLKQFSSGMKQRVKLLLSFLADTSVLLLDEPTSNLDKEGVEWYKQTLSKFAENRTLIVSSNSDEDEIFLCTSSIDIRDYKPIDP